MVSYFSKIVIIVLALCGFMMFQVAYAEPYFVKKPIPIISRRIKHFL